MIDLLGPKLRSAALAMACCLLGLSAHADSKRLPAIVAGPDNAIPACATPHRLMEFVRNRNRRLDPPREFDRRFSDVAAVYQSIGDCVETVNGKCVGVRWDYAFFQTLIETNYLLFTGRIKPDGNNFASIGAFASIDGIAPAKLGERFGSVRDGVLAHLQHILMYAGVSIEHPVYARTRIIAADIRETIGQLGRPVTFSDLAPIWTGTEQGTYAAGIQKAADNFANEFCKD